MTHRYSVVAGHWAWSAVGHPTAVVGVFAEFEREIIIDRVINGMERKAAKGQCTVGVCPLGYRVDPQTQHLQPVAEETPAVEAVFDLYTVRRAGTRAIAADLNARGMRRRSGRPWSYKTVIDVLVNPAYIGTVAFRDIVAEDAHPAIISRDTFALAMVRRASCSRVLASVLLCPRRATLLVLP